MGISCSLVRIAKDGAVRDTILLWDGWRPVDELLRAARPALDFLTCGTVIPDDDPRNPHRNDVLELSAAAVGEASHRMRDVDEAWVRPRVSSLPPLYRYRHEEVVANTLAIRAFLDAAAAAGDVVRIEKYEDY